MDKIYQKRSNEKGSEGFPNLRGDGIALKERIMQGSVASAIQKIDWNKNSLNLREYHWNPAADQRGF